MSCPTTKKAALSGSLSAALAALLPLSCRSHKWPPIWPKSPTIKGGSGALGPASELVCGACQRLCAAEAPPRLYLVIAIARDCARPPQAPRQSKQATHTARQSCQSRQSRPLASPSGSLNDTLPCAMPNGSHSLPKRPEKAPFSQAH